MAAKNVSFFHLHLVSDSTGETLITVARAAAAQYASVVPVEHVYPAVRTSKQLDRVLTSIEAEPGITLYTLLDETLVERLEAKCTELGLPCRSILGPVLRVFQAYLGTASNQKVGAQHILNAEYFKRIDALNYTMLHDDGQHTDDLEGADVVLVGVSRTSKTPTSIYLANRLLGLNVQRDDDQYIDRQAVAEEVAFSRRLCTRNNWPLIDVTRRSIEETAAAVMALLADRRRAPAT
jgi:regulator of PEP synthase PpsR (kinase-PPPase family)